jgi:hypothetical protein
MSFAQRVSSFASTTTCQATKITRRKSNFSQRKSSITTTTRAVVVEPVAKENGAAYDDLSSMLGDYLVDYKVRNSHLFIFSRAP